MAKAFWSTSRNIALKDPSNEYDDLLYMGRYFCEKNLEIEEVEYDEIDNDEDGNDDESSKNDKSSAIKKTKKTKRVISGYCIPDMC